MDLSNLQDGIGTDDQTLTLAGASLSIEGGNTVDLSGYLDNTDAQNLTLTGSSLSIDNGNSVDLSSLQVGTGTDDQTLSLAGTELTIENGNMVDLSAIQDGFEANTDKQTLSLIGKKLTISGGNSVDLRSILGDVYTRLDDLEASNVALVNKVDSLEAEIALLKTYHEEITSIKEKALVTGVKLYQNTPNPTSGATTIECFVPVGINNAKILIYDLNGKIHYEVPVHTTGTSYIEISDNELKPGIYLYTLLAKGYKVDTKKMIIL